MELHDSTEKRINLCTHDNSFSFLGCENAVVIDEAKQIKLIFNCFSTDLAIFVLFS